MSHDTACLELALHFLPDDAAERVKDKLAQTIQDAIEDFLSAYDTDAEIPREEPLA